MNGREDGAKSFAAAFRAAAESALERTDVHEVYFAPAGLCVRVRYAGAALDDAMSRAMAHNRIEPRKPDLEVIVWDSEQSGVALPPEVGQPREHQMHGLGQLQPGSIRSLFDPWEGTLTMLDLETSTAVHWLPDASQPTERDRAAPLQAIFNWWLPTRGCTIVHGATLGTDDGAVILLGPSGAGKSTTALSCIEAGFVSIGDDLCAVTSDGAGLVVHSIYCSIKILQHNLKHYPAYAAHVTNPGSLEREKAIVYLDGWRPESLRRSLPARAAVLLLEKGLPDPVIEPITPARALQQLAPATFLNFPGHGQAELAGLRDLVSRVPCYRMGLAADHPQNARALADLIARQPATEQEA